MEIVLLVIGCLIIIFSLLNTAKNLLSKLVYNVIPFFSGLFIIYYTLKVLEWL